MEPAGGMPVIMPVNYLIHAERVVFRLTRTASWAVHFSSATVAFEIDGIDDRERTGWSVVVTGTAQAVVDPLS